MSIRASLAAAAGRAARWGGETFMHRAAGNILGAIALKIDPQVLESLGTQGKYRGGYFGHQRQNHHDESGGRLPGNEWCAPALQSRGQQPAGGCGHGVAGEARSGLCLACV